MRLLTLKDLATEKGISFSYIHIRRLARAGTFPAPLVMGAAGKRGSLRWPENEIDAWLASRPRAWIGQPKTAA